MNREGILYCAAGAVGVGAVVAGIYLLKRDSKPSSKVAMDHEVFFRLLQCASYPVLGVNNVFFCCIESL